MPRYPNGEVPASALVTFASGTDENGYWEHRLPPSTYRKHLELVRLGEQRRGRTLQITPGYNADRPIAWQWVAWRISPAGNAAYPGTSSHGGSYQGVDMAAMDYGNWKWVWGSYAAFAAACAEVGLEAGLFSWEPWHVIDRNPWAPVPAGFREEEDMTPEQDNMLRNIYAAVFQGGPDMGDRGRSISYSLGNLTEFADRIDKNVAPILRDGELVSLRQEVADAKTGVLELLGRPVSQAQVDAEAVATALAPLIVQHLGTLTDDTLNDIAVRVADEQARRLQS